MSKQQFNLGDFFSDQFKGMKKNEIMDNLDGIAYAVQEGNYTRKLTQEEIDERKSQLADVSITIDKIEKEKTEVMDDFKEKLKEPKAKRTELLNNIRFKSVNEMGRLFQVDNQKQGMMYIFNEEGICVDARALTPSERQTSIRKLNTKAS